MHTMRLMLRWSWRDLRAHWVRVAAIALMIAIGTGAYAGLSSSTTWRRISNEASFGALDMHDVRIALTAGSLAPRGELIATAGTIASPDQIDGSEERLVVDVQVDASTPTDAILVPGAVVGVDVSGEPSVDGFYIETGRGLQPLDAGSPVALLEHNFALFYDLPAAGDLRISGDKSVAYVGQALTPEYFIVAPEGELFFSEAGFAGIFTSLETAQELTGHTGMVNDLVLTLAEGADVDSVAAELESAFRDAGIGVEVTTRDESTAYRLLTRDADNDQRFFNVFAFLILAGAVGAAFNLITRLVEQQRREIGIGMSLGVTPATIAVRPLLVGAQIALLGVVFGIAVGLVIGGLMRQVLVSFLPLPVWDTPFQVGIFARAAVLGFALPFLAAAIPVWRAVRVSPIQALRPAHLSAKGGWLSRVTRHAPLPGDSFTQMPLRNLTRFPRRTMLTVLAIAAAIAVLVTLLGVVDSFLETVDVAEAESLGSTPDRILVDLDGFHGADSPEVRAVAEAATVSRADGALRLAGRVFAHGEHLDISLDLIDFEDGLWTPTLTAGAVNAEPGLVLTESAASDLGVSVGDTVVLRHPVAAEGTALRLADTTLPVVATHPYPLRPVTYMDIDHAGIMGLEGTVNAMSVGPAPGVTDDDVRRELFELDSVAAVRTAAQSVRQVRDSLDQVLGVLNVVAAFVLLLALLIAVNSASISLEARTREHASMFAFGVPVRTALRMAMTENLVIGILATSLGVAGGLGLIWWMLNSLLGDTMPDFAAVMSLEPATLVTAAVLGVAVVAVAPVFTLRRMRRMDLPGTLRLME